MSNTERVITSKTRYVVRGDHDGGIYPSCKQELLRNIFIKDGAKIKGGIWGNNIQIQGTVQVEGSVFARNEIELKPKSSSIMHFHSCIAARGSIHCSIRALPKSPCIRVCGDVYGGIVNLTGVLVYGNIFAEEAILTRCVVLGGIFSKIRLTSKEVFFLTFHTRTATLEKTSMGLPFGISETNISLKSPVRSNTFSSFDKHEAKIKLQGQTELTENDLHELYYETEKGEQKTLRVLTLSNRIVDLRKFQLCLESNLLALYELNLGSQLLSTEKRHRKSTRDKLEKWFFKLALADDKYQLVQDTVDITKLSEHEIKIDEEQAKLLSDLDSFRQS